MYFIQYIKPLLVKPVKPYGITDSKRVARTISHSFPLWNEGFFVGWEGIFLPIPGLLVCCLSFPRRSPHERVIEPYGPLSGANVYTGTAVPAFIRVEDDGWFAYLRVRHEDVALTDLYAQVASITGSRVENDRPCRRRRVRNHVYFIHFYLLTYLHVSVRSELCSFLRKVYRN